VKYGRIQVDPGVIWHWCHLHGDGSRTNVPAARTRRAPLSLLLLCHAEIKEKGVDVDAAILRKGDPVTRWGGALLAGTPPVFVLRDPDGNSFLIG
jgi:hypothetical protein